MFTSSYIGVILPFVSIIYRTYIVKSLLRLFVNCAETSVPKVKFGATGGLKKNVTLFGGGFKREVPIMILTITEVLVQPLQVILLKE